jgi:hypothetical protein
MTLLAVKPCSTVRVRVPAHDRRSTHGLLYPAAVWGDEREQEHHHDCLDIGSASLTALEAVGLTQSLSEGTIEDFLRAGRWWHTFVLTDGRLGLLRSRGALYIG